MSKLYEYKSNWTNSSRLHFRFVFVMYINYELRDIWYKEQKSIRNGVKVVQKTVPKSGHSDKTSDMKRDVCIC